MSLFLCGLPRVGKTTLGTFLAQSLSLPFIDIDARIVHHYNHPQCLTPRDVFLHCGEQRFRSLETEAVRTLPSSISVVSLGGGSLMVPEIEAMVPYMGTLVLLFIPIPALLPRLKRNLPESLKHDQYLDQTLHFRQEHMASLAHHTINMLHVNLCDRDSLSSACEQISAFF